MEYLNKYIKKSHINMVDRFNRELIEWAKETESEAVLYEDINTPFTLSNVRVEDGCLKYCYDGREESEFMLLRDMDGTIWEPDGLDSIPEYIKFWKSCLRRAKRYWQMDSDRLDRISDGDEDDID